MTHSCAPRRPNCRGFTILEVLISMSVFVLALVLLGGTLVLSKNLLRDTTESSNASQRLRKLYLTLESDLAEGSFSNMDSLQLAASPGSGAVGDAVWFLSSYDQANDRSARSSFGQPLWLRNVLYYVAVPTDHDTLYGYSCAGGSNADGYDSFCPHKMVIRKVIDRGTPSIPTDESTAEQLLTAGEVATFLSAPTGFSVISEANVEEARVVGPGTLTFRINLGPVGGPVPGEVMISTQAVALAELGKSVNVGVQDLTTAPQTESMEYSIFPENP